MDGNIFILRSFPFHFLGFPFISFSFHLCSFHFLLFPFSLLSFPFVSLSFPFLSIYFPFMSFSFLSFSFHFPFISFCFPFISFPSISFPFLSFPMQIKIFLGFFWISHYLGPALDQGGVYCLEADITKSQKTSQAQEQESEATHCGAYLGDAIGFWPVCCRVGFRRPWMLPQRSEVFQGSVAVEPMARSERKGRQRCPFRTQ